MVRCNHDTGRSYWKRSLLYGIFCFLLFFTACQRSCRNVMLSVVCVCQSVCSQDVTPYTPALLCTRPCHPWTCSNLFNLALNVQGPSSPGKVETRSFKYVGRQRAVGILLECFLVYKNFHWTKSIYGSLIICFQFLFHGTLVCTHHSSESPLSSTPA